MKKRLICSLAVALFLPAFAEATFTDLEPSHPYFAAIHYARSQNIVKGYDDNTFRPEATINRAEFTKMIIATEILQPYIDGCRTSSFPDVAEGEWYTTYICAAQKYKIMAGYPDGTFRPAQEISFVEAAKVIAITFQMKPQGDNAIWYAPYVEALSDRSMIPPTIQSYEHKITRGELAEIIYRIRTGLQKDSLFYDPASNTMVPRELAPLATTQPQAKPASTDDWGDVFDSFFEEDLWDDELEFELEDDVGDIDL